MTNFHNIEVKISGQSLLAQTANIDESNSFSPIYSIGYKGVLQTVPNGAIKNTISLEYIVEPDKDVSQKLIERIRKYDFNSFPVQIIVAGRTGAGYLNNYSLNITPNDAILATAQYDIYTELTGQLNEKPIASYYAGNISGIGHYWTCYTKTYDGTQTGSILQGNYSFQNNWQPIYKIGRSTPIQVKYINGREQFNFTHEYPNIKVTHSGQNFQSSFTDFEIIEINPLSTDWGVTGASIKLHLSSGKINSNKSNIQENNLILTETSIIKYY